MGASPWLKVQDVAQDDFAEFAFATTCYRQQCADGDLSAGQSASSLATALTDTELSRHFLACQPHGFVQLSQNLREPDLAQGTIVPGFTALGFPPEPLDPAELAAWDELVSLAKTFPARKILLEVEQPLAAPNYYTAPLLQGGFHQVETSFTAKFDPRQQVTAAAHAGLTVQFATAAALAQLGDQLAQLTSCLHLGETETGRAVTSQPQPLTPAQLLTQQAEQIRRGNEVVWALAWAGEQLSALANVLLYPERTLGACGLTFVAPRWRGQGVATWLRAALYQHLCAHYPQLSALYTAIADDNAGMKQVAGRWHLELKAIQHTFLFG